MVVPFARRFSELERMRGHYLRCLSAASATTHRCVFAGFVSLLCWWSPLRQSVSFELAPQYGVTSRPTVRRSAGFPLRPTGQYAQAVRGESGGCTDVLLIGSDGRVVNNPAAGTLIEPVTGEMLSEPIRVYERGRSLHTLAPEPKVRCTPGVGKLLPVVWAHPSCR